MVLLGVDIPTFYLSISSLKAISFGVPNGEYLREILSTPFLRAMIFVPGHCFLQQLKEQMLGKSSPLEAQTGPMDWFPRHYKSKYLE